MKNKDVSRNDELKAKLDAKLAALDRSVSYKCLRFVHLYVQFFEGSQWASSLGRAGDD